MAFQFQDNSKGIFSGVVYLYLIYTFRKQCSVSESLIKINIKNFGHKVCSLQIIMC